MTAFARVLGGHVHLLAAQHGDDSQQRLAAFYIARLLPLHTSLLAQAKAGEDTVMGLSPDDLAA